jgi:hypothetical protein
MVIDVDTGMVPGPAIGPDIGRAKEALHVMFIETGLQGSEREISRGPNRPELPIQEHEHRQNRTICIRIKKVTSIKEITMVIGIGNQTVELVKDH